MAKARNIKLDLIQRGILVVVASAMFVGLWFMMSSFDEKVVEQAIEITRIGVVVPHHDIKKDSRLELWREICADFDCAGIEKVVILSPNHFDIGQKRIVYATEDWTTHEGAKKNFLHDLSGAEIDDYKVREDHGVVNLLAETATNFANADIAAVLIGNEVEFDDLDEIIEKVEEICESNCVIIGSVDFSHAVTEKQAKQQDARTIDTLRRGILSDGDLFVSSDWAEVDSPQTLYVLQQFGKHFDKKFDPWRRTSSNESDENAIVTSHVLGVWR